MVVIALVVLLRRLIVGSLNGSLSFATSHGTFLLIVVVARTLDFGRVISDIWERRGRRRGGAGCVFGFRHHDGSGFGAAFETMRARLAGTRGRILIWIGRCGACDDRSDIFHNIIVVIVVVFVPDGVVTVVIVVVIIIIVVVFGGFVVRGLLLSFLDFFGVFFLKVEKDKIQSLLLR